MLRRFLKACILVAVIVSWTLVASAVSLRVALYPYVPRGDQFQTVIEEQWRLRHPDVDILWVEGWDGGYDDNPQDDFDIYVFDATYLTYFRAHGWLLGLTAAQIEDPSDFLPFAINGMYYDGWYWAIPQLGCTEYLIYRESDTALRQARTLSDVVSVLDRCTYHGVLPPCGTGLMIVF